MEHAPKDVFVLLLRLLSVRDALALAATCRAARHALHSLPRPATPLPLWPRLPCEALVAPRVTRTRVLITGWLRRDGYLTSIATTMRMGGWAAVEWQRHHTDCPPTPDALDRLRDFDAVVVCTNGTLEGRAPAMLGDALASFVTDRGGVVLLTPFASANAGEALGGAWGARGLDPVYRMGQCYGSGPGRIVGGGGLFALLVGGAQALERLGQVSYLSVGGITPGTQLLATLPVGGRDTELVCMRSAGRGCVVHVNAFLPADDSGDGGWRRGSEPLMERIVNGALLYALLTRDE